MTPCVRSSVRRACAVLVLLFVACRAGAEPVTHHFVGELTTITNGSAGELNLRGIFSFGQAVTLDCTVERATTPVQQDAYVTAYTDPVTMVTFTIGNWTGGGAPSSSGATVTNNAPSLAMNDDQYSWNALGVATPPFGTLMLQTVTSTLDDIEGTVFDSGAIPRVIPALSAFEGKTATFNVVDLVLFRSGYVMATLSEVSTPAQGTTWGGIKGLYRR